MTWSGVFSSLGRQAPGLDRGAPAERSFPGGMRLGNFNATWRLVRLNLFADGLRLGPSASFLEGVVPVWEVCYTKLVEV
ncbi:MAG: hypothetical protein ACYDGN_13855 [Acidimicrobiales bacterium]